MTAVDIIAQIGINLVWQTPLLAVSVFVALRIISRDDASTRYNLALSAFFGCLLFLVMPFMPSISSAAPLTAFIASYSSPEGLFYAKLSAASIMAIAPILIIGWFSQKQLVRGLTFGAVK